MEDKFDNIKVVIKNNKKNIDLDLIDKSEKNIYKKILRRNIIQKEI